MARQHARNHSDPVGDVHDDIAAQFRGTGEFIPDVGDDGILAQVRRVGTDMRHGHHVGGVAHGLAERAVIRMVILGTMREHEIRLKAADLANDLGAKF